MKENQSNRRNSKNGITKKQTLLIAVFAAVVCLAAIFLTTSLTACSKDPDGTATPDSLAATIDENTYEFAEGIYVGSVHLGGLVYKDAKEQVLAECDKLIKDFELTVTANEQDYKYTKDDFAYTNNAEEALLEAVDYNDSLTKNDVADKTFELTVTVSEESVSAKVLELASTIDKEAKNATIGNAENNDVSFIKDSTGLKLDQTSLTEAMVKEINSLISSGKTKSKVEATVEILQPTLTYDDLNGKIELISSFTTKSTNTADGNHNMALALASCNGSVIEAGEVWSFNACTGNSNLTSLGYRSATVIIGGKLVPGIGGGLCQASTTIYNAAIRTNMEIVERYNHYYQSTYAAAGLDATIDYPYLDLKLKNTTDYPMYFQCYMSGKTLYCNIYGYQDPSFDEVKVTSSIYDANRAENYYKASAERIFLKDGEEVYREKLPNSTYHYVAPGESATTEATEKPTEKPTKPSTTKAPAATAAPTKPKETAPPEETLPADPVEPPTSETTPIETSPVEY